MAHDADVAAARTTLRTSVQRMRGTADPEAIRAASARACEVLGSLGGLQRARTVLVHHAVPGDLDPTPLVERLAERGVRVLSLGPRLQRRHGLRLGSPQPGASARRAAWRSPTVLAPGRSHLAAAEQPHVDDLDLVEAVVMPGVAFDLDGGRLGQDPDPWPDVLRRLDDDALRIGLARSAQLVPRVPRDPDQPDEDAMDVVVTDRSAHHTGARRRPRDA